MSGNKNLVIDKKMYLDLAGRYISFDRKQCFVFDKKKCVVLDRKKYVVFDRKNCCVFDRK